MKFLGRKRELQVLEREYARNGFMVIYGRRRIGKTTLIKEFIANKQALYFLASKELESLNIQRFAQKAAEFTKQPELAQTHFADWRPLFEAIMRQPSQSTRVIVIDEFPYLVKANPAFPSIMQYIWDELLKDHGIMLVLCGSSESMMREHALSATSPLYGRRTAQMHLQPLSFDELSEGFTNLDFDARMKLFAVTGGVPKYLELFEGVRGSTEFEESLDEVAFSNTGFLYEEPQFLLGQESRDSSTYFSLLTAIAAGHTRGSEICTFLGKQQSEISPFLKTLIELGYLERRVPFDEKYPVRSKLGRYRISDSFMRFWLTYVHPFAGELEMGNMRPSKQALARTFESDFVPFLFEDVSRDVFGSLCAKGMIDFNPTVVGAYWNRKSNLEIDLAAVDGSRHAFAFGECKFHREKPFSQAEYMALVENTAAYLSGPDDECVRYALFSKTGFDEVLLKLASKDKRLVLVNENQLLAANGEIACDPKA